MLHLLNSDFTVQDWMVIHIADSSKSVAVSAWKLCLKPAFATLLYIYKHIIHGYQHMKIPSSLSNKIFLALMAVLGWFALSAQFYININSEAADDDELIIRFFSYFTILTNLITAICCSVLLFKPAAGFFSKYKTLTAVAVYIIVVGIIYNTILRFLWEPEGLQMIVDELLHSVIPVLFVFYWVLFVEKNKLSWTDIFPWLIYPLAYLIFVLIRGTFSGFYPYPFLNADELGFKKVLINSAGITLIFVLLSFLFLAVGNRYRRFMHG